MPMTIGNYTFSDQELTDWYNRVEGDPGRVAADAVTTGANAQQIADVLNYGSGGKVNFDANTITRYINDNLPDYTWGASGSLTRKPAQTPAPTPEAPAPVPTIPPPAPVPTAPVPTTPPPAPVPTAPAIDVMGLLEANSAAYQSAIDALNNQLTDLSDQYKTYMDQQTQQNADALAQITAANKPRAVTPEQTVQYQINQLLNSSSPYMQQAQQAGLATANARGLLNSSMAAGASQAAAIQAAGSIASQDASTYANQALKNQDMAYQYAGLLENARNFNQTLAHNQNQYFTQLGFDSGKYLTDLATDQSNRALSTGWDMAQYYGSQGMQEKQLDESARQFDASMNMNREQFSADTMYKYDSMNNANKAVFADYFQNARTLYDTYVRGIQTDPDLDVEAKNQLIMSAYNDFMSDVDLGASLFSYDLASGTEVLDVNEVTQVATTLLNQGFSMDEVIRSFREVGVPAETLLAAAGGDEATVAQIRAIYGV
ncbi:MAG: hypothetical protein EOM24_08795 [Chloroflexia bacterium]|nr:hypothetical protein [Chloroflexia bacterium]